ncbi:protein FAM149A [Astyanax mexicanus]|uniref:protein FAM149A n=1 Tax=Astyanax mexicanus TaxID=7994 RepID=UPI0020CAFD2C|nr:protein FAM149A [Astyanax mexicanus]
MQVSVEPVRLPQAGSVSSQQCHGAFSTTYGAKLEKRPAEPQRASPWRRLKIRHLVPATTMSSSRDRDQSLKKKLLKEPDRYICSVPVQLTRSVDRGLSSDQSVSACSSSSAGGASPVSRLTSCSGSAGCATGFSTEHSSIYSWRYDEFDRVNTRRVRQLFSALDDLLYEGKLSSKSETLQKECEEWNTHSPHLRILGNQLEPPKQEGVQYIHRRATSAGTVLSPPCLDKREDHSELCVEGHRLAPGPWANRLPLSELSFSPIQDEEEVYEVEGRIEEFLAYDGKETENEGVDQRKVSAVASRDGVPPVSPKACIRDAVADELFDDVWRDVVGLLEELLRKHWEKQHSGGLAQGRTLESSSQVLCEPSSQLSSRGHHMSPSRGPNSRSMFLWANSNNVQDSSVFKINLNGVMTIQAKPLQQRQQGFGERSLCDSVDDGSGMLACVKTQGQRGSTALGHKPAVQRTLPRLSGRARPRHNLPVQSTQVLRGTRLSTVAEDLLSSPASAVPNHRLPLIHADSTEQDCTVPPPRQTQLRGRIIRGGVASAMHVASSLPPLREPTLLLESLSRPNTTHTFRSDTPLKSSLTPMDFACNMRIGRGLPLGDFSRTGHGTSMGVTGFSITCSVGNGFSECAMPAKRRTQLLSSTDGEGRNTPLLGSIGPRKVLSRFPVPARKKLQVVMP